MSKCDFNKAAKQNKKSARHGLIFYIQNKVDVTYFVNLFRWQLITMKLLYQNKWVFIIDLVVYNYI